MRGRLEVIMKRAFSGYSSLRIMNLTDAALIKEDALANTTIKVSKKSSLYLKFLIELG